MFDPAERALLPSLVAPAELAPANGLVALGEGVARLVGGPLGGVLVAVAGVRGVAIADLASYLVAGALLTRLPTGRPAPADPPPADPRRAESGCAESGCAESGCAEPGRDGADRDAGPAPGAVATRGGLLAVLRNRRVRAAVVLSGIAGVSQGIFLVLFVVFVVFVARRLHGGAGETGLLRGVQSVGAIGAGLVLALVARAGRSWRLIGGAAVVFGVVSLLIWNLPAVSTAPVLYAALFAAAGAPAVVMMTGMATFLQDAGAAHERGRIFAALGLADSLGEAVGMVLAGGLTAVLGLGAMLDLQGAVYLAVGLAATRWLAAAVGPPAAVRPPAVRPAAADRPRSAADPP